MLSTKNESALWCLADIPTINNPQQKTFSLVNLAGPFLLKISMMFLKDLELSILPMGFHPLLVNMQKSPGNLIMYKLIDVPYES